MNASNSILLNRFFSRSTFKQLIEDGSSKEFSAVVKKYTSTNCKKTNQECISEVYEHLRKHYQNEYYYKNTLLNKLLLGKHSTRTTTALTELPVGKSKADFVLINGKAVVYEIKTELDNLDRLEGQLRDYYKAFTNVVVVTSEKNCKNVIERLNNSPSGVCVLTSRGTISERKPAIECYDSLSKNVMFKVLRKKEYEYILMDYYDSLPDVSQFEYYRECQKLFCTLPTKDAYQFFLQALKMRISVEDQQYSSIPYELKCLVYFSDYKKNEYAKLFDFLNT